MNHVQKEAVFLKFVFGTSKKQAKFIIANATDSQAKAIIEIAHNLLHLPLTGNLKKELQANSPLLKKLSAEKKPFGIKKAIIHKRYSEIYNILSYFQKIVSYIIN